MNVEHMVLKAHVSSLKFGLCHDVFHHSRERRTEVKVSLPDFRRFAMIGLAAERNVALG